MRILVCGGRDFHDREFAWGELDILNSNIGVDCIIEGAASGADELAHGWAVARNVMNERFPAEWKQLGRRAGPIRNGKMLKEGRPDFVLAFPGGRGTDDMVKQARKAGVPVMFRTSSRRPTIEDLEDFLMDDSGETTEQVRERLRSQGVDLEAFDWRIRNITAPNAAPAGE